MENNTNERPSSGTEPTSLNTTNGSPEVASSAIVRPELDVSELICEKINQRPEFYATTTLDGSMGTAWPDGFDVYKHYAELQNSVNKNGGKMWSNGVIFRKGHFPQSTFHKIDAELFTSAMSKCETS